MRNLLSLIFISLACVPTASFAGSPSFDCQKAKTPDEIAICGDPALSDLDSLVSQAFQTFEPSFQPKRKIALAFLKDRASCGGDNACIAAVQARALETYGGTGSWVRPFAQAMMGRKANAYFDDGMATAAPNRVGECVKTRVRAVTTRFGEPVTYENQDAGTAIEFENGSFQISYTRDELYGIESGQEVVICLMSRPHDCPDGDSRGDYFLTVSRDTGTQWELSDHPHMCGGA